MEQLEVIRYEEKKYHDYCYKHHKLFEKGSWLYKPVQTVLDLLPMFDGQSSLKVLDLGAGVGRNSIPIAESVKDQGGKVVCVDLLDSAIKNLTSYSLQFGVEDVIEPRQSDIESYVIKEEEFDFIVGISSLEHVSSEETLDSVLARMANGTKPGGVNCLVINSNVEEIDLETGEQLDALMEVNLPTDDMINKLSYHYQGWEMIKHVIKPLEYKIERNHKSVLLKTNAITFTVQKP